MCDVVTADSFDAAASRMEADLPVYLSDIIEAKEAGKHFWWRWKERFGTCYDKKFGSGWQEEDTKLPKPGD